MGARWVLVGHHLELSAVLLLTTFVGLGCGSGAAPRHDAGPIDSGVIDQAPDAEPDPLVPFEDALADIAARQCEIGRLCAAKEPLLVSLERLCLVGAVPEVLPFVTPSSFPTPVYALRDPAALADRELHFQAALADCTVDAATTPPQLLFNGPLAVGETCNRLADCESMRCEPVDSSAPTSTSLLSTRPKFPVTGTDCSALACAPRTALGQGCRANAECPFDAYCTGVGGELGTCLALPGASAPCVQRRCRAGHVCDSAFVCRARGAANDTCERNVLGYDTCGANLVCVGVDGDARCGSGAAAGEVCDSDAAPCALGLRCVAGECLVPGGIGAACTLNEECLAGSACVSNACAAQLVIGQSGCSIAWPCLVGTCVEGTCRAPLVGDPCAALSLYDPSPACGEGRCAGGTCVPRTPDGGTCMERAECELVSSCYAVPDGSECAPKRALFDLCEVDADCESSLVCRGEPGARVCLSCPLQP